MTSISSNIFEWAIMIGHFALIVWIGFYLKNLPEPIMISFRFETDRFIRRGVDLMGY
jgi:hypothetical protein